MYFCLKNQFWVIKICQIKRKTPIGLGLKDAKYLKNWTKVIEERQNFGFFSEGIYRNNGLRTDLQQLQKQR